jgi:protein ImuB
VVHLDRRGEGCRRLRLVICRMDGDARDVVAGLARPTRDAGHMVRLFEGRLDGLDPGHGFDAAILEALEVERLDAAQPDLAGRVDEAEALAHLVDRLSARLGRNAVTVPVARGSHLPERAVLWRAALDVPAAAWSEVLPGSGRADRPVLLLDPPEAVEVVHVAPEGPIARMRWRRRWLRVARHAAPERLAPEWWADRPGTRARDYHRVEDVHGDRYWLYREGTFDDGRGGPPRWLMHGLFG